MFLIIIKGTNVGVVSALSKTDFIVIGRGEECDIRILDLMVSRRHCRIEWKRNNFYIWDLNSTNKTFVNKKEISGEQRLDPGDTIKIGDTILLFTDKEEMPIKSVEEYQKIRMSKTKQVGHMPE